MKNMLFFLAMLCFITATILFFTGNFQNHNVEYGFFYLLLGMILHFIQEGMWAHRKL